MQHNDGSKGVQPDRCAWLHVSTSSAELLLQLGKNPSCSCFTELMSPVGRLTLTTTSVGTMRFGQAFGSQATGGNVTMLLDILCFKFVTGLCTKCDVLVSLYHDACAQQVQR